MARIAFEVHPVTKDRWSDLVELFDRTQPWITHGRAARARPVVRRTLRPGSSDPGPD